MAEQLFDALRGLPPLWIVAILSALPVSEVRGGIPAGLLLQQPLGLILPIGILSNILVVAPVVLGFRWVADQLLEHPLFGGFIAWLLRRARSKEAAVEKYGIFALTLFVAIPLPVTGAWTGALVAAVFGFRFWQAMACIALGVLIASTVVTLATFLGIGIFQAITA